MDNSPWSMFALTCLALTLCVFARDVVRWLWRRWRRNAIVKAIVKSDPPLVDYAYEPLTPEAERTRATIQRIDALNDQIRSLVADRDALAKSMAKWE